MNTTDNPELNNLNNDTGVCAICQETIKNATESQIKTLRCCHTFHSECIDEWIHRRNLCPLCNEVADPNQPVKSLSSDDYLSEDVLQNFRMGWGSNTGFLGGSLLQSMLLMQEQNDTPLRSSGLFNVLLSLAESKYNNDTDDDAVEHVVQRVSLRPVILHSNPIPRRTPLHSLSSLFSPPHGLSTYIDDQDVQCAQCLRILHIRDIKRCSACHEIRYCSERCQLEHWPIHRQECREL